MLKNYQVIHKQTNDNKVLSYEEIRKIVLNETDNAQVINNNHNTNNNINNKTIKNKFDIF